MRLLFFNRTPTAAAEFRNQAKGSERSLFKCHLNGIPHSILEFTAFESSAQERS